MRSARTPATVPSAQVTIDSRKEVGTNRASVRRRNVAEIGSRALRVPAGLVILAFPAS